MNEYCPHCGQSIRSGATFCGHCGKAIDQTVPPQTYAQAPARAPLSQNKWLLPGAGAGLLVLAVAAFMLLTGGSDSPRPGNPPPVNLAKSVIAPAKVAGTADDLASTISTLNKAQLNVMARTTSATPADPKVIDKALQDVAADAMRVAELSNVMSQTVTAQATTPQQTLAAGNLAQQYDSIAQTAYGQLIEAQNQRVQLAQGQTTLPQITQSISSFGAQMWNTGVTINGRAGNPFEPFITGTPQVEISINLTAPAVQTVTVQLAPNLAGWVAASSTTYSRPITIQLLPAPNFDPLDNELLLWMLTFDGQAEPYFAQRYALSRLEQYRRGLRNDRVGITSLTGSDWTDVVVNNERANGRYVNMYDLPDYGTMGLNLLLPRGIAVSELTQIRAGIIPSFRGGFGLGFGTPGTLQELALLGLNLNGAEAPSVLSTLLMQQAQSFAALAITDFKLLGYNPAGKGRGTVDVSFGLFAESPLLSSMDVRCNGVPALKLTSNSLQQVKATLPATVPSSTLACELGLDSDFTRMPAQEALVFIIGTGDEIDQANKKKEAEKNYWEAQRKDKLDKLPPLSLPLPPVTTAAAPAAPKPPEIPPPPPNRLSCPAIKGTDYLSEEERAWYLPNCNTPPPSNAGAGVKSNPAAGPVLSSSSPASKPQTSAAAPLPLAPQANSGSTSSSGATFPGGNVIPNSNTTGGVIQSLQQPPRSVPQQPAVIPQQPGMMPQHPAGSSGGSTGSGSANSGSSNNNNANINGNRMDCVAIDASGYKIPGGAEEKWFKETCTDKVRPCTFIRTTATQNLTGYERWYLVNRCVQPVTITFDWAGGGARDLNFSPVKEKVVEGAMYRVCITGTVNIMRSGKSTPQTAFEVGVSDERNSSLKVDQNGCMDMKASFILWYSPGRNPPAPSPGKFTVTMTPK